MTESLIQITQLPEIQERLLALKSRWEQKAADAERMAATEETVKAIKAARADMRKEFDEADSQRKAAKSLYMAPWLEIEKLYSDCVSDAYRRADAAYKAKIDAVEGGQKEECEKTLRAFFAELAAVQNVPWLRYEQAGVKVTLAEAKKKIPGKAMSELQTFVERVSGDVDAIGDDAETMAEYKINGLNLALAQRTIRERRAAQETERKAAEERAEAKRREAEAVSKVDAVAPPVVAPPVAVETPPVEKKRYKCTFTVRATREQLLKLREYMDAEGMEWTSKKNRT